MSRSLGDATQTKKKCANARMENEIVKWQN